ncbi:hypothetical protein ADEAN_000327500 [Angomonas deanei]|uniref:Uncharacterized protein n=1 Tax=Angomonas deanei TaxID=59799 RepID=A0A7G2CAB9_9TRYP|nr:hypothetical protein ADEAN_000327500 [Angomonas deanei]
MQLPSGETLLNLKAQRTEPPSWSKLYVTALRGRRGTDEDDEGQGSLMDVHLTFVSQALAYLELHPDGGEQELSNENLRMIQNVCQTFGRVAQLSEVNSVSEGDLLQYITELTHQWHIEQNRRL